jgi:protein-S-isoprenylcysteine O-methyltransferase Ste14
MNKKAQLLIRMLVKGILGFLLLGIPLFGCAGTLHYANAWVFISSLCTLMLIMGLILLIKYPETLERRLKAKESETAQKGYVVLIGISFLASFALAGFDYRFGWSKAPFAVSAAAWIIMLIGYILYCMVVFQNSYASRVVEIQKGQIVISTGLYAVVRHPMYFSALLLFLSMPLVLGSYIALIPMLVFPVALVLRIRNEEAVLMSGLDGYSAYAQKTKYRLIPYLW